MKLEEIIAASNSFVENSPLNRVPELDDLQLWETDVLFGVAAADDPIFEQFKTPGIVGPHHISPQEWLPGAQSVISFFCTTPIVFGEVIIIKVILLKNGFTVESKAII